MEEFLMYVEEDNETLARAIKTWLADFYDFQNRRVPISKEEARWVNENLSTELQAEIFGMTVAEAIKKVGVIGCGGDA